MKAKFSNKRILTMLVMLFLTIASIGVGVTLAKYATVKPVGNFNLAIEAEGRAYAVYSKTEGQSDDSLDFYYGNQVPQAGDVLDNGKTITAVYENHLEEAGYEREWGAYASVIKSVTFYSPISPISIKSWFDGFTSLTSFNGLENLDTSKTTNMLRAFRDCSSLSSLDLSGFDTNAVTNMSEMFRRCGGLTSLVLGDEFKTGNVKNTSYMFAGCEMLTTLDVSNFNTEYVTTMRNMFAACQSLSQVDISSFTTPRVENMSYMFSGCSVLQTVTMGSFSNDKLTNMSYMFNECWNLTSLDLSGFATAKVKYMEYLFNSCGSLRKIFVSDTFVTTNVTSSHRMFHECNALVGGMNTPFDENHTDVTYARIDGGTTAPGYFTGKARYRLTFDANGGTNVPADVVRDTATVEIPADAIPTARTGYTFLGWSTSGSTLPSDVEYKYIGDGFSKDVAFSGTQTTVTLYAIWSNTTITFEFLEYSSELPPLTAVEGITWGAWISTIYNTNGKIEYGDISGHRGVFYYFSADREYCYITDLDGEPIKKEDVIKEGENYMAAVADEI